jgi:uncharacterized protein (DUF3820 family)
MFYAPGLILGGTEGVETRLNGLRSQTHFGRYQGRQVQFSCFALSDSFGAVPRPSSPVFMFFIPDHIFDGTDDAESRFRVLRSQTRFGRYRGRRVQFSCFALPDSFSAELKAPGPVFMFCSPGPILGGTEGVGSSFLILCCRIRLGRH